MKVLVLSLLRAGDLVMQRSLFAALKARAPNTELHLVLNDEVSWIAPVLKEVGQFHIFPRERLQRLMGENDHHITRANLEISRFIAELNHHRFDELVNLTHNRISAYLSEEISAPVKRGLHTEGPRFQGLENSWLRLFNDRFSGSFQFPFHYIEILARSFDLKPKNPQPAALLRGSQPIRRIFLQAFTSDSKKNWSLSNFRNLLDELYGDHPDLEFRVLSSEKEKLQLEKYFHAEEICTWNMQTLAKEFGPQDLLITGDTVTMHLAAQNSAKVIEIALGSADPWKTGPYGTDHYVLMSQADCYPCHHSSPCRKMSHLCSEPVTPKLIRGVVKSLIHDENVLASFSEVNTSVRLFKTKISDYGFELISAAPEKDVRVLNKLLWQKIFSPDTDISVLRSMSFGMTDQTLHDLQCELNEQLYYLQSDFEEMVKKLGATQLNLSDVQESRRKMGAMTSMSGNEEWTWLFTDLAKLSFSSPLHFLSAYQDRLEILKGAIYYRNEIIMPMEVNHESGSRTISEDRVVKA